VISEAIAFSAALLRSINNNIITACDGSTAIAGSVGYYALWSWWNKWSRSFTTTARSSNNLQVLLFRRRHSSSSRGRRKKKTARTAAAPRSSVTPSTGQCDYMKCRKYSTYNAFQVFGFRVHLDRRTKWPARRDGNLRWASPSWWFDEFIDCYILFRCVRCITFSLSKVRRFKIIVWYYCNMWWTILKINSASQSRKKTDYWHGHHMQLHSTHFTDRCCTLLYLLILYRVTIVRIPLWQWRTYLILCCEFVI